VFQCLARFFRRLSKTTPPTDIREFRFRNGGITDGTNFLFQCQARGEYGIVIFTRRKYADVEINAVYAAAATTSQQLDDERKRLRRHLDPLLKRYRVEPEFQDWPNPKIPDALRVVYFRNKDLTIPAARSFAAKLAGRLQTF